MKNKDGLVFFKGLDKLRQHLSGWSKEKKLIVL